MDRNAVAYLGSCASPSVIASVEFRSALAVFAEVLKSASSIATE